MCTINQFPNEIIFFILSELDSTELLKMENVCQQWREICFSSNSLWKKGIELDCQSKGNAVELEKQARGILLRSGGKMPKWRIKVSASALMYYQTLFEMIPSSNVEDLDISLTDEDNYGSIYAGKPVLQREIEIFLHTLKQCTNLTSIQMSVESELQVSFGFDLKFRPLSKCRLESISLRNISLDSLYSDGTIFEMVSRAKTIELFGSQIGSDDKIVGLLKAANETLERCSVRLSGTSNLDQPFCTVSLPQLKRLEVSNYHGQRIPSSPMQYSLSCPNLQHLTLDGSLSSTLCANLLTDSIKTIYLKSDENLCRSIQSHLRRCCNLCRIRMEIVYPYKCDFPSELIRSTLDELVALPIEEFVLNKMVRSNREDEEVILEFFQKRSKHFNLTKMKIFLLFQDTQVSQKTFSKLSQYTEMFHVFLHDETVSKLTEEERRLRLYGYSIGE